MRKDFGAKPFTYPQPVLILGSYDKDGNPDAMNAAWGGITEDNEITICLSAEHKTTKNLQKRGAFTVSMADEAHVVACDYLGITSANKTPDKVTRSGLHVTKSELVDAPLIDELALALECKVMTRRPAVWWAKSSMSAVTKVR